MPRVAFPEMKRMAGAPAGGIRSLSACKSQPAGAGFSEITSTQAEPVPASSVQHCEKAPQVLPTRLEDMDASLAQPSAVSMGLPQRIVPHVPYTAQEKSDFERRQVVHLERPEENDTDSTSAEAAAVANHTRADIDAPSLLISANDISVNDIFTEEMVTFVPVMGAPRSPAHSSAPCSPASSVVMSGACASSITSAFYNTTSSCAVNSDAAFAYVPVPASLHIASLSTGSTGADHQDDACDHGHSLGLRLGHAAQSKRKCHFSDAAAACESVPPRQDEQTPPSSPPHTAMPPLSYFAAANSSSCSSRRSSLRDQNSVTIKATTVVKDAAGAIDKILSRGVTALVTALRCGSPPYNIAYDSLNQAVKAIAVARQYAKETGPEGAEVTFLPFHRYDTNERADPGRFAFLVFPVPRLTETLKTADETVLNVARGSDVQKMAGAIIAVMLDRGQAVMKAAGSEAIFVAMSAVVNARHRLVVKHGFDLMLAAAWITEDTVSTMGRESKFLRFNILKTEPAGPKSNGLPSLPALLETC